MRRFQILAILIACLLVPLNAGAVHEREHRLDALFDLLKEAQTVADAQTIEVEIWKLWTVTGESELDSAMYSGIAAMRRGNLQRALNLFDQLTVDAPQFAEAWNKRATIHYMLGNHDASIADIMQTLTLEPRHFAALSGLGMIFANTGREEAALRAFERALKIHPHLPGAKAFKNSIKRQIDAHRI
ncbi:MAG: tetratricopeptide repeat protein [Rhodospirillales bacterium]|jgi:tetratricopeptide (TPR) repeat protein|nr:tetratricopeptide repeat protein [Rhodospirillales bacterium]